MSELLQEFVDSGNQRLRVDRAAGVIRGVKLLGLMSRNGRRYREDALTSAVALYEGAKVNINHPKGHPLSPRDYQDRLGVVRGVQFRSGEGLFGDLHFNPKHALSEQLVWDAEHAPQNVGMSHNVMARTTRSGDETVVEAITKVQSIDLVADPATTSGLYEHAGTSAEERQSSSAAADESKPASTTPLPHYITAALASLTLEQLRRLRPDLICEVENAYEAQLETVQKQLDEMIARDEGVRRRERILQLLEEHDLPLPTKSGGVDSHLVSSQFIETLMAAADEQIVRRLVEERAELVRAASRWNAQQLPNHRRPRSRDQAGLSFAANNGSVRSAAEFAAAVCGP
ncbi:MAG: hypothetical protein WD738_18945 [Pirellulales bacterium]